MGRYDTMLEQVNIRKAELNSRLLRAKSDEAKQEENIKELEEAFARVNEEIGGMDAEVARPSRFAFKYPIIFLAVSSSSVTIF